MGVEVASVVSTHNGVVEYHDVDRIAAWLEFVDEDMDADVLAYMVDKEVVDGGVIVGNL